MLKTKFIKGVTKASKYDFFSEENNRFIFENDGKYLIINERSIKINLIDFPEWLNKVEKLAINYFKTDEILIIFM